MDQIGTHVISPDENRLRNSEKALGTFRSFQVHDRRCIYVAWTVNISPKADVPTTRTLKKGTKKAVRSRWGRMTPREQRDYFDEVYIPKVVNPMCNGYIAHYELTKIGMIHMHVLCVIVTDYPDFTLAETRSTVNKITLVQQIARHDRFISLNHIVICDKLDEWMAYLNKSQNEHPLAGSYKSINLEGETRE